MVRSWNIAASDSTERASTHGTWTKKFSNKFLTTSQIGIIIVTLKLKFKFNLILHVMYNSVVKFKLYNSSFHSGKLSLAIQFNEMMQQIPSMVLQAVSRSRCEGDDLILMKLLIIYICPPPICVPLLVDWWLLRSSTRRLMAASLLYSYVCHSGGILSRDASWEPLRDGIESSPR